MSESPPNLSRAEEKARLFPEIVALAKELNESREVFPFLGLDPRFEAILRAEIARYPEYSTPLDDIIARCTVEGIKVVLGPHPDSGTVHILPAGSDNINDDSLFPRHLLLDEAMDVRLKRLVVLNRRHGELTAG